MSTAFQMKCSYISSHAQYQGTCVVIKRFCAIIFRASVSPNHPKNHHIPLVLWIQGTSILPNSNALLVVIATFPRQLLQPNLLALPNKHPTCLNLAHPSFSKIYNIYKMEGFNFLLFSSHIIIYILLSFDISFFFLGHHCNVHVYFLNLALKFTNSHKLC